MVIFGSQEPRPLSAYEGSEKAIAVDMTYSPDGRMLYFLGHGSTDLVRGKNNLDLWSMERRGDSWNEAWVTPGMMLAERYRIVGLLGKGGMGELYRADDLKLRQSVALKFPPEALSKDAKKLERFHHEVRVARQVSHPNVCRVYDIAETDGQHFISMEYIDGEDLASVLRRMGKPSTDKAVKSPDSPAPVWQQPTTKACSIAISNPTTS